jgi:hypothetical protein
MHKIFRKSKGKETAWRREVVGSLMLKYQTKSYGRGSRKLSVEGYFKNSKENLDSKNGIVLRD